MSIGRREAATVLALLALLLGAAQFDVVFQGGSLVYSNNYNPVDYRSRATSYGPDFEPLSVWSARNLHQLTNAHDPAATWWQWEPAGAFLRRGIELGEWPWWDPYVGGGAPAMANLTPSFCFPPYLL
ncbi:MAG TPA: hypothetical protein DD490_34950, partial [Acidobacteria bacterium]|nr:hypothetical protein [Acidobacteriota bacterium]